VGEDLYTTPLIGMLELIWGEGWLSPGGPEEVDRVVTGLDLSGKHLLDIGCGVGGVDFHLLARHGVGHITAIDVEENVLAIATKRAASGGLSQRIRFVRVAPGPLPFVDHSFDIVFSKDAIVHIADKHALMREVFRVLRPGGWFAASDWLISHDREPSPEMARYIAAEGLDFGMASPSRYHAAMLAAGFSDVEISSRNSWYRETAKVERDRLAGPLYAEAVLRLGRDFVDHNIDIWNKMLVVLDSGEHCPAHLRARRPVEGPGGR
jgi:phosphoethanolamine N-methyltransferase